MILEIKKPPKRGNIKFFNPPPPGGESTGEAPPREGKHPILYLVLFGGYIQLKLKKKKKKKKQTNKKNKD